MQYNLSPETIIKKGEEHLKVPVDLDKLIHKTEDTSFAHQHDFSMSASGYCFSRKKQGVIPNLCESFYAERKANKRKMLHYQAEHEKIVIELRKRGVKI